MKYVFMGGVYPPEAESVFFEKAGGKLSFAANRHQWSMINGIEKNINEPLTIISTQFIPPFPKYKDLFIKASSWQHTTGASDLNIGFLNLRGIRTICPKNSEKRELTRILKQLKEGKVTVFVYTMRYSQMKAVYELKKSGMKFHACLIVPDVPNILAHYGERTDLYSRISTNYNLKSIDKYTERFDSFVLLSEAMREIIKIGNKPFCVVDGICSNEMIRNLPDIDNRNIGRKYIVYTGSLHREYGICDLLQEFKKIPGDDYCLKIAGFGNAIDDVKAAVLADSRIEYVGLLQADEVRKLQQSATVLVNPRSPDGIDAKYSFPSKTIEYMLMGKPIVMNRLRGMDAVYEEYLFTPQNCGCNGFAETIMEVCNLSVSEREKKAEQARSFIIENKTSSKQMKHVLDMLEGTR